MEKEVPKAVHGTVPSTRRVVLGAPCTMVFLNGTGLRKRNTVRSIAGEPPKTLVCTVFGCVRISRKRPETRKGLPEVADGTIRT